VKRYFDRKWVTIAVFLLIGLAAGYFISRIGSETPPATQFTSDSSPQVWTCAMHPQIRQPEPGKCPICGMDLIPVAVHEEQPERAEPFVLTLSAEAAALADVRTTKADYARPHHEIHMTGKIAVDEQRLAVITANFSGRIEKLFVDFTGQNVIKGQKLATVYSPELITSQQELLEAAKTKHINPALYDAAREKLRLWKITENQIEAIETSGQVLTEFDVYTDLGGVVLSRKIALGDYIGRGSVLFEIADLSSVWVLLDAYESDLAWLKLGDKVTFAVASRPAREFSSTIYFIDPRIDPQTRTAAVRAQASNKDMLLKPEMFVRAKLNVGLPVQEKAMVIPRSALLWTGIRSVVYVRVPESKTPAFEMREISLGPRAGDYYLVEEGLKPGEEVVVNGLFAVDAAAQLSGRFSMMNRPEQRPEEIPARFIQQLDAVTSAYLRLVQALVSSDFEKGRSALDGIIEALAEVDMKLLKGRYHDDWMMLHSELSKVLVSARQAKDLESLRIDFSSLSNLLIETNEKLGPSRDPLYKAYCPMAFNNQGAYWITTEQKIENPYYGSLMLTCGEIKGRITFSPDYKKPRPKPAPVHQH